MGLSGDLKSNSQITVKQIKELTELFGIETRNKYSVETTDGRQIGYVAEQQKGILGFFMRQFFGHWRTFELHIFDGQRNKVAQAYHPFRFFFQKLDLTGAQGEKIGSVDRRYGIFTKKFDVHDNVGKKIFSVSSPIWKIWTFRIMRENQELALIQKLWSGMLKEAFLDADNFKITFHSEALTEAERMLLLTACVYIDLLYFEKKAGD